MSCHTNNSVLPEALKAPSSEHPQASEIDDEGNDTSLQLQQRQHSQHSDEEEHKHHHFDEPDHDHNCHVADDDDNDEVDVDNTRPPSPPSAVASYMMYFTGAGGSADAGGGHETKAMMDAPSSSRLSYDSHLPQHHTHPHPPMGDSFSSYVATSSMSSFDTPRIDNINPANKTLSNLALIVRGDCNMNGWLTNSNRSGDNSLLGGISLDDDDHDNNHHHHDMLPRHSDFTIPTSNADVLILPAPPTLHDQHQVTELHRSLSKQYRPPKGNNIPNSIPSVPNDNNNNNDSSLGRRSILGSSVGRKYRVRPITAALPATQLSTSQLSPVNPSHDLLLSSSSSSSTTYHDLLASPTAKTYNDAFENDPSMAGPTISIIQPQPNIFSPVTPPCPPVHSKSTSKPLLPKQSLKNRPKHARTSSRIQPRAIPMSYQYQTTPDDYYQENGINDDLYRYRVGPLEPHQPSPAVHETIHAQSLLLGIAFMVVWLPNNVMAPNLTQMAAYFDMSNEARDLYLGSYCALAVGVFSLPLSALLGFMADFYSRKYLFVACVLGGAVSAAWTGWSSTFASLFVARLCSGGCMSGSVPVAFSLLGDLFATEERNAASSGLTAMMGLGIIAGQVYAGMVGPTKGWQYPFYVSAVLQLTVVLMIVWWVTEPVRGGKEKALQGMFQSGNKYNRQLTLEGFFHAMHKNASNSILLWQGFFTSLPWGIVFVFLNDYLSQEKGFSVPEATFMVMLFGVGCAIGGIAGGHVGQLFMMRNRSYLPLYMAATTFLGIFPFLELLNSTFPIHNGYRAKILSILGGCIASLPSVNARPCILNVNPPETRGAALTAANLLVTLGRGIGPSCIVLLGTVFQVSRQVSFNVTLAGFWTVSAIQLVFLAKTLPIDQDAMEASLVQYAAMTQGDASTIGQSSGNTNELHPTRASGSISPVNVETTSLLLPSTPGGRSRTMQDEGESIMSIEDYMTAFDGTAARRSFDFVRMGIRELNEEIAHRQHACLGCKVRSKDDDDDNSATVDNDDFDEFHKYFVGGRYS
jgi:MFS family permease